MDKASLKRKVLSDMNTKENMISDLQRELKEEMNKPSSQWDCEKISEITETIHNLSCDSKIEANETRKEDLLEKVKASKTPKRKIPILYTRNIGTKDGKHGKENQYHARTYISFKLAQKTVI